MKTATSVSEEAIVLRQKAEDRIRRQGNPAHLPYLEKDLPHLSHELQIRQIVLEMQSEEIQRSRAFVDAVLTEHMDFYDSAPVGFVTLDSKWTITNANATACGLLGIKRFNLTGSCFESFVAEDSLEEFRELLRGVLCSTGRAAASVSLIRKDAGRCPVRIKASKSLSGNECRLVIIEMAAQKQDEETVRVRRIATELERKIAELEETRAMVEHLQGLVCKFSSLTRSEDDC